MKSHHFTLGNFQCIILHDTKGAFDADFLWTNAPKHELDNELKQYNEDIVIKGTKQQILLPFNILYIRTDKNQILVDAGVGQYGSALFGQSSDIYERFMKEGINPKEIDTIFLTHGHLEHIGTLLTPDQQPFFTNARIVMGREEYKLWTTKDPFLDCFLKTTKDTATTIAKTIRRHFKKLDPSRFMLVDGEKEVLPGFRVIPSPGHTPGNLLIEIKSCDEKLLCTGDTFIHPIHASRPEWVPLYDHSFQKTIKQRKTILASCTDQDVMIYAPHFPYPSVGYFKKGAVDNQVRWIPKSTSALDSNRRKSDAFQDKIKESAQVPMADKSPSLAQR